jgi:tripartite-type tricarboxylate transporter receptor subunit TctC
MPERCIGLLGALLLLAHAASAQTYPNRPLRIIAPFAPGGGSDLVARLMARELQHHLAQSVIVENRPGAGGVIGSEAAARAAPDGYTLLVVPISHAANVSLTAKLPYHPEKDFAPIVHIGSAPNVVLTHPSVPARSVAELVKLAQARPGDLLYASAGSGSSTHLATELFKMLAKVDLLHVAYKGGGAAITVSWAGRCRCTFPVCRPQRRISNRGACACWR